MKKIFIFLLLLFSCNEPCGDICYHLIKCWRSSRHNLSEQLDEERHEQKVHKAIERLRILEEEQKEYKIENINNMDKCKEFFIELIPDSKGNYITCTINKVWIELNFITLSFDNKTNFHYIDMSRVEIKENDNINFCKLEVFNIYTNCSYSDLFLFRNEDFLMSRPLFFIPKNSIFDMEGKRKITLYELKLIYKETKKCM